MQGEPGGAGSQGRADLAWCGQVPVEVCSELGMGLGANASCSQQGCVTVYHTELSQQTDDIYGWYYLKQG